jgi:probable rRNA maturation factor
MKTIHFHFLEKTTLPERIRLRSFLERLINKHQKSIAEINIYFCTNQKILKINKKHLKHNYYTDIITFDFSPNDRSPIISDIFISVDMVRINAGLFQTSFVQELHRVIFHGFLHLVGYNDKSPDEKIQMRKKESFLLKKYFVSRETKK